MVGTQLHGIPWRGWPTALRWENVCLVYATVVAAYLTSIGAVAVPIKLPSRCPKTRVERPIAFPRTKALVSDVVFLRLEGIAATLTFLTDKWRDLPCGWPTLDAAIVTYARPICREQSITSAARDIAYLARLVASRSRYHGWTA